MTLTTYLICFLAGLVGQAFHILQVKIPTVKKQAQAANLPFSFEDYLKEDMLAIVGNVMAIVIALIGVDLFVTVYPKSVPYLRIGFVLVGFCGSSLLLHWLGKAEERIRDIVDEKTNIADKITKKKPQ